MSYITKFIENIALPNLIYKFGLLIKKLIVLIMLFNSCMAMAMAKDTNLQVVQDKPPSIISEETPEFQIEMLRLREHYVSYELGIYSDGTVEFLGRPDKPEDQEKGAGKHYAHIPLADFKVLSSVLKREGEAVARQIRMIGEKYSEIVGKAHTQEKLLTARREAGAQVNLKIAPKIARNEQPMVTLEGFSIGYLHSGDIVEIYADGAMHFDNSIRHGLGHQYSQITRVELSALQRAFESIQPAIIHLVPAITEREHPIITLETLSVREYYIGYKVEIYSDGTVHFFGKPGGKYGAIGDHYSKVGPEEVRALLAEFKFTPKLGAYSHGEKTDFFDLPDHYEVGGYDGSGYAISLEIKGRYKRVSFVGQLADLQQKIERAVVLNQWMCVPFHPNCGYFYTNASNH